MGKPVTGRREGNTFVGEAVGEPGNDATLREALQSAAEVIVKEGVVTSENDAPFEVVRQRVVIGNQHVKTFQVTVTASG